MYAEVSKKNFLHTRAGAKGGEGIYQNWQSNQWEVWLGGELVGTKGFAEIQSKAALESWLDTVGEQPDGDE